MYITLRQNTAMIYIAKQLILELCEEVKQRPGAHVSKRYKEQEAVNFYGAQVLATTEAETEDTDKGRTVD